MTSDAKPSDEDRELLRERVRALIDATGSSQRKIETDCGWSSGTLTRVFGGRKAVDRELVEALAAALGTTPEPLVAGTTWAALFAPEASVDSIGDASRETEVEDVDDTVTETVQRGGHEDVDDTVTVQGAPLRQVDASPSKNEPSEAALPEPVPEPLPKPKPEVDRPEIEVPEPGPPEAEPTRPGPEIQDPAPAPEPEQKPVPNEAPMRMEADAPVEDAPAEAEAAPVDADAAAEETPVGGVRGFFRNIARKVWGG